MDLVCDEIKYSICKVNIDGGIDLNVALILEDRNFYNSSEEAYEINFDIIPLDRLEGVIEQLNIAHDSENETWLIDEFPRDFYENPENLIRIQLEFQNLTKIKSDAFRGAYNLNEIDLDHNQILYIGEDSFEDLQNLTSLSLTKNNLTVIRSNTFTGAINLRRVHLNQNKIEHIEDGAFNLPNLEYILLQNNRLKKLSGSMFIGAPKLREAVFEENELIQINDAFTHLHQLEILILDYNQIEDINLSKFANLAALNHLSLRKSGFKLTGNIQFDQSDMKVNSSSKLQVLDLAENGMSDGFSLILQLRMFLKLEIINLEYNELTYLNHSYKIKIWYPYLQIINLAYNPISCGWVDEFVMYFNKRNVKVYPWLNSANGCVPDD